MEASLELKRRVKNGDDSKIKIYMSPRLVRFLQREMIEHVGVDFWGLMRSVETKSIYGMKLIEYPYNDRILVAHDYATEADNQDFIIEIKLTSK